MNDHEIKVVITAMRLRAADPQAWTEFVEALRVRSAVAADHVVSADLANLQQMQGRAQEARALVKSLVEAPRLSADMKERGKFNV